jgi:hypothetical protein
MSLEKLLGGLAVVVHDGKVFGSSAVGRMIEAFGRQTAPQQLADRGSAARHAPREAPSVDRPQFFARQHDLQTLASIELAHDVAPSLKNLLL